MKLPRLFKKKEKDEEFIWLKKQLKKLPRRKRKQYKALYELAKKGYILKVNEDIDNKERIKPGVEWYNGQVL